MSAEGTRERHRARLVTVCFVLSGEDVLLLRHPDHSDRFAGQWNGIGGHEETGLRVRDLSLRGVVHESGLLGHAHVLFVFLGRSARRSLRSPEGIELRWHPLAELSSLPLVHDAALLLEWALAAKEPFFVTEQYDGSDRRTSLRFDGESRGPA